MGRVVLVLITTPPASGMVVYDEIRESVDRAVGRINGRFRTLNWAPVHYLFRSVPFEEVTCYYAAADVMWITPLRDGLNLVAKEFVAAQDAVGGSGALVISEFAGASVELHGALITNPYDLQDLADVLCRALTLGDADRKGRIRRLSRIVAGFDVQEWSQEVLAHVRRTPWVFVHAVGGMSPFACSATSRPRTTSEASRALYLRTAASALPRLPSR